MTKKIENKESLLKVGVVSKPHGIKGEIFIRPYNSISSWPKILNKVFIGESFSSFEVECYQAHKNGFIFKLKNLNHRDQSENLKGSLVFLPKNLFLSRKGEPIYLSELLGFEVFCEKQIGVVKSFQSTKFQDHLLVQTSSKQSLSIPFVQDYIQNVDFLQKKIFLKLPKNFLGVFHD